MDTTLPVIDSIIVSNSLIASLGVSAYIDGALFI